MCGIAGKVHSQSERRVDRTLLQSMADSLIHRGPDEEGFYVSGQVGLCMRRLRVIDLPGGKQPIANEDETKWLVFNGEIYNYLELRKELELKGHKFRTNSDTETIIHLYEEEGVRCVQRLRGMFAIAIWDVKERSLFLARDRLGKKPLFYSECDDGLVFASEMNAILCDSTVSRSIDVRSIEEYMTCLFVPHPRTIFQSVKKLPPGSYAHYVDGALTIRRYWELPLVDESKLKTDADTHLDELRELLIEAVSIRTMSDVPMGAFLSGGLDSSLVVALLQKVLGKPVRTFCVGFEENTFSELSHAKYAAELLETNHEEHIVNYHVKELLPEMALHFGEPFADSSAIPTYHLSRVTRQSVTVALSGDGGDEVFGGYRRYRARLLADMFNRMPSAVRWSVERIGEQFREPATYYGSNFRKKIKRFLEFSAAVRADPGTSWAFFLPGPNWTSFFPMSFWRNCLRI